MKYETFYRLNETFIRTKTLVEIAEKLKSDGQHYKQLVASPPTGATPRAVNNNCVLAQEYQALSEKIYITALKEELAELHAYLNKPEIKYDFELYSEMFTRKNHIETYLSRCTLQPY
ncbi:MAG: hypothetical protein J6J60_03070 [Clostridia bacterium]|nr:hypothetical protein [Clostridia bacterium]